MPSSRELCNGPHAVDVIHGDESISVALGNPKTQYAMAYLELSAEW